MLFTSLVAEEKRDALNRGLSWLGYGRMATGVYALPCIQRASLDQLLKDLEMEDNIVHMQAQVDDVEKLKKLVKLHWKLDDLRQRYKQFISQYLVARKSLNNRIQPGMHSMFLLRVLLIHEYRRILLNDPELPATLLPGDWEGYVAQSLTGEIYRQLAAMTTHWVSLELFNADGHLKAGSNILETRFRSSQPSGSEAGLPQELAQQTVGWTFMSTDQA